jgi:hypothetical protein
VIENVPVDGQDKGQDDPVDGKVFGVKFFREGRRVHEKTAHSVCTWTIFWHDEKKQTESRQRRSCSSRLQAADLGETVAFCFFENKFM